MNPTRPNPIKLICLALTWTLACATNVFSAPGEHIDPKNIQNKVSITLGIKGTIQFKQQGNILTEPKLIKEIDEKLPGVGVEFSSVQSEKNQPTVNLMVRNHYPKVLRYRAAMRLKGRKEYVETRLDPVMAQITSGEFWSDPIEEIILFEFKLTDEKMQ